MSPQSDRDAGFCSGGSEIGDDRLSDSPHSQIDVSDDSIEVRIPQVILSKNKRKSTEPAKVVETELGPIKKRIRFHQQSTSSDSSDCITNDVTEKQNSSNKNSNDTNNVEDDSSNSSSNNNKKLPAVFRPWTVDGPTEKKTAIVQIPHQPIILIPNPADIFVRHPAVTTLHRPPSHSFEDIQEEPLALVVKRKDDTIVQNLKIKPTSALTALSKQQSSILNQSCSDVSNSNTNSDNSTVMRHIKSSGQRNYKNMTRERRIEANARERNRVHTISAAYETLRKCIPSYSSSQKLSKLAVLRIACAYILALSRMNGEDLSADGSKPDVNECIEAVSRILEREGKVKRDSDDDE